MSGEEADYGIGLLTDQGGWPSVTYPEDVSQPGADAEEADYSNEGVDPLSGVVAVPDSDALATDAAIGGEAPAVMDADDAANTLVAPVAIWGEAPAAGG